MGFFPVSKISNLSLTRDLTEVVINNLKEEVNICKGEDCIDEMYNHINKNGEVIEK